MTTVSGWSSFIFAKTQSLIPLHVFRSGCWKWSIGGHDDALYWATRNLYVLCKRCNPGYKSEACESPQRNRRGPSFGSLSVQVGTNDCKSCTIATTQVSILRAPLCSFTLKAASCIRSLGNLLGTPSFAMMTVATPQTASMASTRAGMAFLFRDALLLSLIGFSTNWYVSQAKGNAQATIASLALRDGYSSAVMCRNDSSGQCH